MWADSLMDKALDSDSKDQGFDPLFAHFFFKFNSLILKKCITFAVN